VLSAVENRWPLNGPFFHVSTQSELIQTLADFYRKVYVPQCLKDRSWRTLKEYNSTVKFIVEIFDDPVPGTLTICRKAFVDELKKRGNAEATIAKHLRNLNAIFRKLPEKQRIYWAPIKLQDSEPRQVSDSEFQALYRAFGSETRWPKHLPEHLRPHFWRTVMCFAAITALRREAILGVEFRDVNWNEQYLCLRREIDKAKQKRYKPLTPCLFIFVE